MANIKEKDLPTNAGITSADYFRIVTSGGASEKASAADFVALQAPTVITKEGCIVYRLGKFREVFIANGSAWCATLAEQDRPPNDVDYCGKVYNGSSYVDCLVRVNTAGEVRVTDFYGGTISGAQYTYLRPRYLFYFVQ